MTNKELYKLWLKIHSNKPINSPNIKEYADYPAYYLSPEEIVSYINAKSPFELFINPDITPFSMDYPTTAINVKAPFYLPQEKEKNVTALFPTSSSMKYGLTTDWMDELDKLFAQAVYEHEVAHARDIRINPYKMWSFPNKGLLTWQGLFGGLLQREFPALVAEEQFRFKNE